MYIIKTNGIEEKYSGFTESLSMYLSYVNVKRGKSVCERDDYTNHIINAFKRIYEEYIKIGSCKEVIEIHSNDDLGISIFYTRN